MSDSEPRSTDPDARERFETLGSLVGGVAHDFNNMLSVIMNYAEFIAEDLAAHTAACTSGDLDPVLADVAAIRSAGQRAAELTHELLIFGRLERARPELLSIEQVVGRLEKLLMRTMPERIALLIGMSDDVPSVFMDRLHLEQLVMNLAFDARSRLSGGGSMTITSGYRLLDAPVETMTGPLAAGAYATVTVEATPANPGGLTPARSAAGSTGGDQLGRASVERIIQRIDAGLTSSTLDDSSSRVTVYLPVADEEAPQQPRADRDVEEGPSAVILVAEDEARVGALASRMLRGGGYTVLSTGLPSEALRTAETHQVDLLLADVVMPNLSGPELAARIRDLHPGVRVVFMSGYPSEEIAHDLMTDPDPIVLAKPFSREQLLSAVRSAIAKS